MATISDIENILQNAKPGLKVTLDCQGSSSNFTAHVVSLSPEKVQAIKSEDWTSDWPPAPGPAYPKAGDKYWLVSSERTSIAVTDPTQYTDIPGAYLKVDDYVLSRETNKWYNVNDVSNPLGNPYYFPVDLTSEEWNTCYYHIPTYSTKYTAEVVMDGKTYTLDKMIRSTFDGCNNLLCFSTQDEKLKLFDPYSIGMYMLIDENNNEWYADEDMSNWLNNGRYSFFMNMHSDFKSYNIRYRGDDVEEKSIQIRFTEK